MVCGSGMLLLLLCSRWNFPVVVDAFSSVGSKQHRSRTLSRHSSSSISSSSNSKEENKQEEPEPLVERQPRRVIDITNEFRETVQSLPVSFIAAWPTWILDQDGALQKIPDDKDGYVNPTSIEEVWHPVDLLRPTILSCALGFHIRDGTIRHVFPAVDVGYPHQHATNNTNISNPYYRNRGLCSVPRAYQWIEFHSLLPEEYDQYIVQASVIGKSKSKIEEEDAEENKEDKHVLVSARGGHGGDTSGRSRSGIANAIERMSICLAEQDATEEDGVGTPGSQIVHVLLPNCNHNDDEEEGLLLPKADSELHVTLQRATTTEEKEEAVEEKPGGRLQVRVVTTMAGSDSDYLPAVYRPLFQDEPTLLNPVYAQYQHNKRQREER